MEMDNNDDMGAVARAQTEFVLDLYKEVVAKGVDQNAVLSPVSISLALAMVAGGAKGESLNHMTTCLKLPRGNLMHRYAGYLKNDVLKGDASRSHEYGLKLACANRLWVDESFQLKPSFQILLRRAY